MRSERTEKPKFGLLHAVLLPVMLLPIIIVCWLWIRGDAAEQAYWRGVKFAAEGDLAQAAAEFQKSADLGNADAACTLGMLYMDDPEEEQRGTYYLEFAAQHGSMQAEFELGRLAEQRKVPDYDLASLRYRRAALAGHIEAMNAIARLHLAGLGADYSPLLAKEFYLQSANAGNIDAQVALGELYLDGSLGEADPEQAKYYFKLAADGNAPRALTGLGKLHEESDPPDLAQAEVFYRKAVALGDPSAMVNLGDLCLKLKRNTEANEFFTMAAEKHNFAPAWQRLGVLACKAEFPDYVHAKICFEKAAQGGSASGWYNLGALYESGQGTKPDKARAIECYTMASKLGLLEAAARLAELNEEEKTAADESEKDVQN